MTERLRSGSYANSANPTAKMSNDLSPRKTMLILVIVVGCFAVLWPKVFYPMLVGSANQHIKPSPIDKTTDIKQERPLQLRSELVHPAFRERGRAIPQTQTATPSRPSTRVVEGRPGPIPGMRPTLGGAGHVVPPPKQGTGSMGLIMPIYTFGIVIFFTYTVMKIVFKKQPEALYPPVEPDLNFRREVFESERTQVGPKLTRESVSSKLGDAELDQLRRRLRETERAMERIVEQMAKVPLKLQDVVSNGNVPNQQEEQPSVKVLGMEMTASCEGGKKWSRPDSPVLPTSPPPPPESAEPPQEIFLEGALPAQSHLLVANSATEAQKPTSEEDPAVVLAGKMTLSVISLDSSENGTDESSNSGRKQEGRSSSNVSEDFEKIEADQIDDVILEAQNINIEKPDDINLLEEIENDIKELTSKNLIGKLGEVDKPVEIQSIEEQLFSLDFEKQNNGHPSNEVTKDFIEKETAFESNINFVIDPKELLASELNVIDNGAEGTTDKIEARLVHSNEEKLSEIEKEIILEQRPSEDVISKVEEHHKSEVDTKVKEAEIILEKEDKELLEQELLENLSDSTTFEKLTNEKEDLKRKETEDIISEPPFESNVTEVVPERSDVPKAEPTSETEQVSNVVDKIISDEKSREVVSEENTSNLYKCEPEPISSTHIQNVEERRHVSESGGEKIQEIELHPNISADEIKSFEKLNEAIADLSSEFGSRQLDEEKQAAVDKAPEDLETDEEIEYEYEDSDNEIVDEEIRNLDRLDDLVDPVSAERLNGGDDQEQSKYNTTSSATLAENDISDEEDLENEDEEEIEEIIEYVTDDEDEIEEIEQPGERNNVNHINDGTNAQG